jgi:tubulin--tyrosine ligase/tubulin polyglutamylase TTLL9
MKRLDKLKKFVDEDENKFVKKYEDIGNYFKEEEFIEEKKKKIQTAKENNNKKNKILYYVKEVEEVNSDDEIDNNDTKYPLYRNYFDKFKLIEKVENKFQFNIRDKEKQRLLSKHIGTNTVIELPETHSSGKNMWIVKAINLNRGMCIKIANNYKKMMQIVNKFKEGVNYDFTSKNLENTDNKSPPKDKKDLNPKAPIYNCEKIIIQKYIERPLLYKGRKCDMRVWVLITQNLKVYFFKEGHLKTCSIPFDIESKDAYSHITNYSFQKYNEYFQKYEKGNEVPFYDFQKFIDEKYPEKNYKLNINLYSQIKEIISISMKSVKDQIDKNGNTYQFEIFGYDFMLDEDFNLFLIEVNTNPGIEESSPWIQIIIPRMLDDALRLTIDQLFNPGYDFSKMYKKDKIGNNLKIITNNFKEKIESENRNIKTETIHTKHLEKESGKERMNTESINMNNLINKIDKRLEIKTELNKNDKYISPFPVPGYKNDENLWEFVCDLTSKDPLDEFLDKENDKCYTGIRYLFNKKKNGEN